MIHHGWNTWDVYHLAGMTYLPTGLRAFLALCNPSTGERFAQFNWRDHLRRLGPHAADGRYQSIELTWQGEVFNFEAAAEGEMLVCRLVPAVPSRLSAVLTLDRAWGGDIHLQPESERIIAHLEGQDWQLRPLTPEAVWREGAFWVDLKQPFAYLAAPLNSQIPSDPLETLARQRESYLALRLQTSGWLQDAADGLTRALHWNTIWEPTKERVCTPVSREWCMASNWGGYVLFEWDTFFGALMAGLEQPELAAANIRAILQEVTPQAFIPNYSAAQGHQSIDRSQPPVGAYCLLKLYRASSLSFVDSKEEKTKDAPFQRAFLVEVFPPLLRWHQWWLPHRDGNNDGLLEWGSDPLPGKSGWEVNTLRAAMYESGLDNSPMYDETVFNSSTHTMELADVGLNALYALDAWALAEMATELGLEEQAARLRAEHEEMGVRINRSLWNEAAGIYQNRHWDGQFSGHLSPTNFYPLLAGVVPPERAERMVREHLLNEREFWGEYVIPSIARSDPGYHNSEIVRDGIAQAMGEYWRGRIWGPMNFLVCEGLRRCGFDAEAHQFARRSLDLFLKEWQSEAHIHENYHDLTGEGDDVQNSNPVYHWGALLAYLGIQDIADRPAWNTGWRFGSLTLEPAEIKGIRIGDQILEVSTGLPGLQVKLDGRLLLKSNVPVLVSDYRLEKQQLDCRVEFDSPVCQVIIGCLPVGAEVTIITGGRSYQSMISGAGLLMLELEKSGSIRIEVKN